MMIPKNDSNENEENKSNSEEESKIDDNMDDSKNSDKNSEENEDSNADLKSEDNELDDSSDDSKDNDGNSEENEDSDADLKSEDNELDEDLDENDDSDDDLKSEDDDLNESSDDSDEKKSENNDKIEEITKEMLFLGYDRKNNAYILDKILDANILPGGNFCPYWELKTDSNGNIVLPFIDRLMGSEILEFEIKFGETVKTVKSELKKFDISRKILDIEVNFDDIDKI